MFRSAVDVKPPSLTILHRDEHLIALAKPGGLPSVPDESGDPSLFDRVRRELLGGPARSGPLSGDEPFLGVVQRLDRPVSGVLVMALQRQAAAHLSAQLRDRRAAKTYWAVSEGIPKKTEGRLIQWLLKDPARNLVHSVSEGRAGAKRAVTAWRVLSTLGDRALLELCPETGRSHQLRVAAAKLGCPLCGDVKYGASRLLKDRTIGLHARSLKLRHPVGGGVLLLVCELPDVPLWNLGRRHLEAAGGQK
jgi:23S rRNA pseudouridine1911/1915/1917 synthase